MKRVFVFQDFKSQKFWSIEVVGTDVTVNYGKFQELYYGMGKRYETAQYISTARSSENNSTVCAYVSRRYT